MRPTLTVDLQDSIELAARKLREDGCGILPVTQDGAYAGAITESQMAVALASGTAITESVEGIAQGALTAHPSTTGAEALRMFGSQNATVLIVIDAGGRVLGIVTPSDLFPKRILPPRPPMVGGMATPFGVYLTTGSIRAGVSHIALITTGMTLFGLFASAIVLSSVIVSNTHLEGQAARSAESILQLSLFLLGMRVLPLAGIHAAEHKVVHAIERGEELVPSTVRRMPRVHPRCGTNLAVGGSLFVGMCSTDLFPISLEPLKYLLAGILTLFLWRPLGSLVQRWVTTKRPSDKQLEMGIRSGNELLEKYITSGAGGGSAWTRIVNSGMLHVLAGSMLALGVVQLGAWAFNLPGLF